MKVTAISIVNIQIVCFFIRLLTYIMLTTDIRYCLQIREVALLCLRF